MKEIGRYQIVGELGRGAMGVVMEARDPLIGRTVAIKIIRLDSLGHTSEADWMRERLFREARSAGALSHPGIVVIHDLGQHEDLAYIAMERVDGPTLEQVLAAGARLDTGRAMSILRQTSAALDYAHENGVVHRDIKPGNLMLHKGHIVKITDFGIAKIASTQQLTQTGMVMGTPSYMSPEQITAQPVDGRSDQFSLAVIAFELLTGRKPFEADTLAGLVHQIVYEERPVAPSMPEAVNAVLQRALSKEPPARFPSCTALVDALERGLAHPPPVRTAAQQPAPPPRAKRTGWLGWAGGAGAFLAVALAAGWIAGHRRTVNTPAAERSAPVPITASEPKPLTPEPLKQAPPPPQSAPLQPLRKSASGKVEPAVERPPAPSAAPAPTPIVTAAAPVAEVKPPPPPVVTPTPPPAPPPSPPPPTKAASADARTAYAAQDFGRVRTLAETGDATAQNFLGLMYQNARGVAKDEAQAVSWFRKAADQGNAPAQTNLAFMYQGGHGVSKDEALAIIWYRAASDQGYAVAQNNLGSLYQNAQGLARDDRQAVEWFQKAAAQGNASAQNNLGVMYENGRGIARDEAQAVAWYQKAADQGLAAGEFDLGLAYESGHGVRKDIAAAVGWYRKAAQQGLEAAATALKRLGQ